MSLSDRSITFPPYLLLVDDDDGLCAYLRIALKLGTELETVVAHTGEAGLDAAAKEQPRLIILDLMLPDMDGFEFLRRFRAEPENTRVPIIGFSVHAWDRDLKDSLVKAGCVACLEKGRGQDLLVPLVKKYLAE